MKRLLRGLGVAALATASTGAVAQLPDYGYYPSGHVVTDIDGGTHDIDAILNSGKAVIIDAFADWCGPCWSYHTAGTLEDVYNAIGDGGTGDVAIFGLEADPSVPEANISDAGTGTGDWTLGGTVEYPLANDDAIAGNINLAYYPTLILICPDRSTTEVGQVSASAWEDAVAACPGLSTDSNDPRIVASSSESEVNMCGDGDAETEIKVIVQNYSTDAIDGTYSFEATVGGDVVATADVAISLDPYAATEVNLGMAALAIGSNDVEVSITTDNDDLTNDVISTTINVNTAADLGQGDIIINATFDGYGSEVGFGLAEGTPATSDPFEAYPMFAGASYPGQIDFNAIGTWADADAGFSSQYVSLTAGCYHLYMFDNYGDGMTFGSGGELSLESPNSGIVEDLPVDYGSGTSFLFEVTEDGMGGFVGIDETEAIEFANVYPNPAANHTTVSFNLTEASDVKVELINAVGQVVYTNNMGSVNGEQNVAIDATNYETGIYFVNISVNNQVITKRVSIVK